MLIVDSLAQSYNWSYEEIIARTMPQILLLNHAAWVNRERSDRRYKAEKTMGASPDFIPATAGITFLGKPIDQLTTEEYTAYLKS